MSVLNFTGRVVFPYFADEGKTEFYHQLHQTVVEYISYRLFWRERGYLAAFFIDPLLKCKIIMSLKYTA